jgi:serine protease Do
MKFMGNFFAKKITLSKWAFLNALITLFLLGMLGSPVFQSCNGGKFYQISAKENNPLLESSEQKDAISIQKAFHNVAKSVNPAVVYISTEKKIKIRGHGGLPFKGFPFFDFDMPQQKDREHVQKSLGTGFIISAEGYIITNHHVVGGAQKITVKVENEKEYNAKVIGSDPVFDLALLKIDAKNLPVVFLGDSDKINVGDWAIAVGNPYGLSHTFTVGVISAIGRKNIDTHGVGEFIQTDASINPGNSGGPLLNINGEVIGINRMIYSQSGGSVGIGFAIPINLAKEIVEQLKKHGKVIRGWLGVQIQEELAPEFYKELGFIKGEGIFVAQVVQGSPAEKAGIKEKDVILTYHGKTMKTFSDLSSEVKLTKPGATVPVVLLRNKKKVKVWVTIKEYKPQE